MYFFIKRILDIFVSLIIVILLLPLFIVISLVVLVTSGRPIFFYQVRMGKNWKPFNIIKFRSMIKNADKMGPGITSNSDSRITWIGKILRRAKLDELPQLLNVLKGDMSLIGPRPELPIYVNYFKNDYSLILNIRPGITDYAAIEFRNEESLIKSADKESFYINQILPIKISLYKKYLSEMGPLTDFKILFNTIKGIMK